ncbi:hypothetical protein [Prauserella cavernicola]|uniref:Uncharacterized protein n=1 Tax=Prauserella cavernicola TaxID=2800127 RepID=A0A934QY98_9PSEU|nr:hypothetical protein [Prauserella cavernicola]MBK1788731.1 hypothetical protein [Prauserella cavernicola]
MIELLGILLVVQGVGGLVNRIADSSTHSWFVQLHLLPEAAHIPASVALALVGLVLASIGSARRKKNPS